MHSYDAFHTRHVGPGVKGIIGMHRFNICLVVVLLPLLYSSLDRLGSRSRQPQPVNLPIREAKAMKASIPWTRSPRGATKSPCPQWNSCEWMGTWFASRSWMSVARLVLTAEWFWLKTEATALCVRPTSTKLSVTPPLNINMVQSLYPFMSHIQDSNIPYVLIFI